MKKFLLTAVIFILIFFEMKGQASLDSINCYCIPMNLKTVYNISKNEIIKGYTFEETYLSKSLIKEEDVLNSFLEIELKDSTYRYFNNDFSNADDLDARFVLLLHWDNLIDSIVIDKKGFYFFKDELFKPSTKLLLWINEFCLGKSAFPIFDDQSSRELKIKYNFLVNTLE